MLIFAAVAIALQLHDSGNRSDRIEFYHRLLLVRKGWGAARVREVLGAPNDVLLPIGQGGRNYSTDFSWSYGTHGHTTLASRGQVRFEAGRVVWVSGTPGRPPPPMALMSDAEPDRHLLVASRLGAYDPLSFIQTVNDLLPLGKQKALAVLLEFDRIVGGTDGCFAIAAALFGLMDRPGPTNRSYWPGYPTYLVDDIPFTLPIRFGSAGASGGGFRPRFFTYAMEQSKYWVMRPKPLKPPDDPFPSFLRSIKDRRYPFGNEEGWGENAAGGYSNQGRMLKQVLELVRTAWQAPGLDPASRVFVSARDYNAYHRAFLAMGAHWDSRRQCYVRAR